MTATTQTPSRPAGRLGRPPGDRHTGPDGLTLRQGAVVDAVLEHRAHKGYPPSMREIGAAVGLASTSSVAHQIGALERMRVLGRDPYRPRAYRVEPWWLARHRPEALGGGPDTVWVPLLAHPRQPAGAAVSLLPLPRALVGDSGEAVPFAVRAPADAADAAIRAGDIVIALPPGPGTDGHLLLTAAPGSTAFTIRHRPGSTGDGEPHTEAVCGRIVAVVRTL
ncbi:LexA family protein [Streptomyces clavuligerus]|uniref:LexA family protein n=1 Tax=Streptomyces clavuligerus TaxID=1901 RepID=UPI00020D939E|nr:LexA repressor [Streptomyces clavuligerus]WDN56065.1 LexA repressor [Streptomyces clavuligerus]